MGFEPTNNGFAIRPLSPLGHAAGSLLPRSVTNILFMRSGAMPRKRDADRPSKPYRSFLLTAHPNRRGPRESSASCGISGQGTIPKRAHDRSLAVTSDLHAGREPTVSLEGLSVKDLVNSYFAHQEAKWDTEEMRARHFRGCLRACPISAE